MRFFDCCTLIWNLSLPSAYALVDVNLAVRPEESAGEFPFQATATRVGTDSLGLNSVGQMAIFSLPCFYGAAEV